MKVNVSKKKYSKQCFPRKLPVAINKLFFLYTYIGVILKSSNNLHKLKLCVIINRPSMSLTQGDLKKS